ncbi:MAG: hypothetical protein KAH57_00375 [Thermoplasmata archaeon]|nr:hypothetical protein [Thermoplasmata archaeon]
MRKMRSDDRGGMEGVPLQLVIVVVIGVAALGILIGWLAMAGDTDPVLRKVSVEPETISIEGDGRITKVMNFDVYVYDSEGNEVDGAVLTFSGSVDEKVVQKADSGDTVEVTLALAPGEDTGTVVIKAEKGGGMGSCETTVIVLRSG